MRPSFRLIKQSLLVFCVVGLSACGSDDPTDPGGDPVDYSAVAGVWTLQSANGDALPVQLVEDNTPFTLHAGALTLTANGTCQNSFTTTPQGEAQKTEVLPCTFTLSGSAFSYTESSLQYSGTLTGNSISLVNDGNTLVYTR
jgi:hypothetical protein